MVGETRESSNQKNDQRKKGSRGITANEEVREAKKQFFEKAAEYDPLKTVRKHPYLCLGSAFAIGFGLQRTIKSSDLLSLMTVGLQLAVLSAKFGLLIMDKKERS